MRIPQTPVKPPPLSELRAARWFAGKHRTIDRLSAAEGFELPGAAGRIVLLDVHYAGHAAERYLLPRVDDREPIPGDGFWAALLDALRAGPLEGAQGRIELVPGPALDALAPGHAGEHVPATDQSNTLVVVGGRLLVKAYRRLHPGAHPEVEILAALGRAGAPVPAFAGAVHHVAADGTRTAVAVLQEFVPGAESGWEAPIDRAAARLRAGGWERADEAEYHAAGAVSGRLHEALGAAFGLRPAGAADAGRWLASALADLDEAVALDPPLARDAPRIRAGLQPLGDVRGVPLTRIHGDLHHAQLLRAGGRVLVVDFEGDPTRPLADRRRPDTPVRDVAGLLRSIDHIGSAAGRRAARDPGAWIAAATGAAAEGYAETAARPDPALLEALELAKECQELVYAHRVLPEWAYAPRLGLERLLRRATGGAA